MLAAQTGAGTRPQNIGEVGTPCPLQLWRACQTCHPVGDEGAVHVLAYILCNRYPCTRENLHASMGMAWRGDSVCLWTFPAVIAGSPSTWLPYPCPQLPEDTCSHLAFIGTYAMVCHAMNGMENGRSVRQWHQWPVTAKFRVAQQNGPLYLDSPHCQVGGLSGLGRAT